MDVMYRVMEACNMHVFQHDEPPTVVLVSGDQLLLLLLFPSPAQSALTALQAPVSGLTFCTRL